MQDAAAEFSAAVFLYLKTQNNGIKIQRRKMKDAILLHFVG